MVPRARKGFTLEDGDQDECDPVGDIETDNDVGECAEPAFGEDAQVEAADGDFSQGDNAEVEEFIPEVNLSSSVLQLYLSDKLCQLTYRILVILSSGIVHMSLPKPRSATMRGQFSLSMVNQIENNIHTTESADSGMTKTCIFLAKDHTAQPRTIIPWSGTWLYHPTQIPLHSTGVSQLFEERRQ